MRLTMASLASAQARKWVLPSVWLLLVVWFLNHTLSRSRYAGSLHLFGGNGTSNSSMRLAISEYYSTLTHHGKDKADSHLKHEWMSVNVSTSNKAAVIIETRRSGIIVPLVLHFSAVLGPDWPVIIYTSSENFGSFSTSAALLRHQRAGRVIVRPLAEGVWFPNWDSVSDFLTTPWLWRDLAPAEHILIFQADSILCANSVRRVDDFFEYDLIGAPIEEKYGVGFNGGLSLRKRSTVLRILDEWEWAKKPEPHPEDQWYFARMRDLEDREVEEGITDGINLPPVEIARTFAVETIDYPHPLGLHQPNRFLSEHMVSLDEWCPEYRLATEERIS
ncbi:hypothetical protein BJ875DRAFT_184650 [Amylocarpus encephaloides]|uniref:DUF5672 domain-containing protein n=1 Tax=Amylocarpus encephaloides TaxID=45428 RepID=A0A9P8C9F0_9HELO|nr:hypothetical protein BJ875DRAFT_184650 [Amylocarpus encephaloides]